MHANMYKPTERPYPTGSVLGKVLVPSCHSCFPALVATTVRPPEGPEALPCLPLNRPTLGPNRESSVPATHLLLQLPNKDGAAKAPTVTGCI